MNELGVSNYQALHSEKSLELGATIDCLRMENADKFDRVRFRYIEALFQRAALQPKNIKFILNGKIRDALQAFTQRFSQAKSDAEKSIARVALDNTDFGDELQQLFSNCDFNQIKRLVNNLEQNGRSVPLSALTLSIEQHSRKDVHGVVANNAESLLEPKTIRYFRNTWSRLSAEKLAAQAIVAAPDNAGPLNSHMLILRSISTMRDISPDYLNRFMSYADALLCLDQFDKTSKVRGGKDVEKSKKTKSIRGRIR